jgi:3-oxoacyl-[acyl-carrier protein] reductase
MRMLGRGKIVNVAGGGATGSRPFFSAYAASKAALVRFTECLADELRADNIQVNAISPGPARTAMTREILIAGPIAGERSLSEALEVERGGGVSLHLPAALVVFLTSPSADRVTGRLVSAIWDDWQAWAINPDSIDQALGTEGGTLRRVKPAQTGGYHH